LRIVTETRVIAILRDLIIDDEKRLEILEANRGATPQSGLPRSDGETVDTLGTRVVLLTVFLNVSLPRLLSMVASVVGVSACGVGVVSGLLV